MIPRSWRSSAPGAAISTFLPYGTPLGLAGARPFGKEERSWAYATHAVRNSSVWNSRPWMRNSIRSYAAAHRTTMPTVEHRNHVYANNRAEVSHQPTRQREYHMRGFKSPTQTQQFLTLHGLTHNLFRLGRHLMPAGNYRILQTQAFQVWKEAVGA